MPTLGPMLYAAYLRGQSVTHSPTCWMQHPLQPVWNVNHVQYGSWTGCSRCHRWCSSESTEAHAECSIVVGKRRGKGRSVGPPHAGSSSCSCWSGTALHAVPAPNQLEQRLHAACVPDRSVQAPHMAQFWSRWSGCWIWHLYAIRGCSWTRSSPQSWSYAIYPAIEQVPHHSFSPWVLMSLTPLGLDSTAAEAWRDEIQAASADIAIKKMHIHKYSQL